LAHLISGLVGVVVGAVLTSALQYFFWKRQHRVEVRSLEERESRRERAQALERFREVGGLLVEMNRIPSEVLRANADTAALIATDRYRLQGELRNAMAALREAFPASDAVLLVEDFHKNVTVPGRLQADQLLIQIDVIVAKLRALVSISDK
jgi:hypothetical protein